MRNKHSIGKTIWVSIRNLTLSLLLLSFIACEPPGGNGLPIDTVEIITFMIADRELRDGAVAAVTTEETVTISTPTRAASIYYTTDGSTPDDSSELYREPIELSSLSLGTHVIKVVALKSGLNPSEIASATLEVILPPVATPIFSLKEGIVRTNQSLTITTDTTEAIIRYTTNGDNPDDSGDRYVEPIEFGSIGEGIHTIRAVARKSGLSDSAIASATFIVALPDDVDANNNGLIEIFNLNMLNNIRHNLAGTSYKTSFSDSGITSGAPETEPANCNDGDLNTTVYLCGYELMQDMDFARGSHYDSGSVNMAWRPTTTTGIPPAVTTPDNAANAGFSGFGAASGETGGFTAIFDGNSHTIKNLYIRNINDTGKHVALFRLLGSGGIVRNVGVIDASVYGKSGADTIGGLVGTNEGTIIASHASVLNLNGGGSEDYVGGLVGWNNTGTIVASYATGSPDGGDDADFVGGLVGWNTGTILASYATGSPNGGAANDTLGGLVGWSTGPILASYATGNPNGDVGIDNLGGLVGRNTGPITASYAMGNSTDNLGLNTAGSLAGVNLGSAAVITESYGFGNMRGGVAGTVKPSGITPRPSALTARNAGASWNSVVHGTADAWNFSRGQNPALVYADYDGEMEDAYPSCMTDNGGFPDKVPGTSTRLVCGTTLIGGNAAQRR